MRPFLHTWKLGRWHSWRQRLRFQRVAVSALTCGVFPDCPNTVARSVLDLPVCTCTYKNFLTLIALVVHQKMTPVRMESVGVV